ncbi:MAG TPA: GNAT family N-acetyltransferase [Steroidobacteraceae bacterium]|nr:GNAT family N-acetyltransferase [Steroidobacteraceae bacterium]
MAESATSLRVRRASPADAARLSLLGRATFLESYAHLLPVEDILAHAEEQHAPARYQAWLADPACRGWLAEAAGGAPVGYLVAAPPELPLPDLGPLDVEIRRIYVLHRFQRLGVGRWMMEEALAAAAASGRRRVLLGVYSRNEQALAFYARLGFVQAGTREFRVGAHDYHDFILQRLL